MEISLIKTGSATQIDPVLFYNPMKSYCDEENQFKIVVPIDSSKQSFLKIEI